MIGLLKKIFAAAILIIGIAILVLLTPSIILLLGLPSALVALVSPKTKLGRYGFQLWIGFDKFFNAVLGGKHKETISSRLGKAIYYNYPSVFGIPEVDKIIGMLLDQVDHLHCWKSINWSVGLPK